MDVVIGVPLQRFRWIEPGEFLMGSPEDELGRGSDEGPRHVVRLTEGYWLADTACSQAVWQAVMGSNPSDFTDDLRNPVERVSWKEVQGFLRKVEKRLSGVKAGLPSEAEWEYACRAGSDTMFSWGNWISPAQANYAIGSVGEWPHRTVPVRSYAPNAWGLYQMHGNVWEWCEDGHRAYDGELQIDPHGLKGDSRVLRGGAWVNDSHYCRAADRYVIRSDERGNVIGFRLALWSKGLEGSAEWSPKAEGARGA